MAVRSDGVSWAQALAQASQRLAGVSDSPRLDAELLLAHVLKRPRAALLANADQKLSTADAAAFEQLLGRRLAGEPAAYLIGAWEFWSLPLRITHDVLVPRPETELLVEWALQLAREASPQQIADLGTGSGAIALALAKELPQSRLIAIDSSAAALAVARANASALRLANVAFLQESFASFADDRALLGGMFDLVVSNPPYVAEGDPHLRDLTHEPSVALTAGGDGLDCLRAIVAGSPRRLRDHGWLLVEHGFEQGAAVRALFADAGFKRVETRRDLAGRERATGGQRA